MCVCVWRWFEQDAEELLASVRECLEEVGGRLGEEGVERLAGVGITNQRETTIVWNKTTGKPLHSAIGTAHCHSFLWPWVAGLCVCVCMRDSTQPAELPRLAGCEALSLSVCH